DPPGYWIKNCMLRPRGVKNAFGKYCSGVDRGRDGVVLDQSLHSHGLQHQVDLERGRGGCRRGLGVASHGAVGADQQLSSHAMTLTKLEPSTMNTTKVLAVILIGLG